MPEEGDNTLVNNYLDWTIKRAAIWRMVQAMPLFTKAHCSQISEVEVMTRYYKMATS
jgi:hypothetical protein